MDMSTVTSRDGTPIAYERMGSGPAIILIDGAMGHRALFGQRPLAEALRPDLTAVVYDRRGRGESGEHAAPPDRTLEREIEDIAALIDAVGGHAYLYGISSGAALALEAALALGDRVQGLAMYEPPYNDDPAARAAWRTYREDLREALAADRPGDAVGLFVTLLGMPPEDLEGMRQDPSWALWEAVGPSLAYDAAAMGEEAALPTERAARLTVPTLVIEGGATEWGFLHVTALALARAIPNARHLTLEGQTHEVSPEALAPALIAFCQRQEAVGGTRG
jgi:pimeloyl-ACP methyl ester carboxylesterase